MSFWIDSWYSLATFAALFLATCFAYWKRGGIEHQIAIVLWVNWLSVRIIRAHDPMNFRLWLLSDAITAIWFFSKANKQARSCGALFAALMVFDHWSFINDGGFDGPGAVAEAIGYLCIVVMLWGGDVSYIGIGRFLIPRLARIGRGYRGMEIRLQNIRRSFLPANGMASTQNTQTKDGGS